MTARQLLLGGVIAGPVFMALYLGQAFTRAGFDITRHPASILSNGDLGWIQVLNFLVCGLLVIAGAIGMRQALRGGPGGTWAPLLLTITGMGLCAAAVFSADPVDGFPPGTPLGPPTSITTTGLLHFVVALVAFAAWIAASFVFARRFAVLGETGWAVFSIISGAYFLVAFVGTAVGISVVAFAVAVALMWAWTSATSAKIMAELPAAAAGAAAAA